MLSFGGIFYAQTISGVVTDNNGPLPGANVIVKGTSSGTATDFDGNYTLENVDSNAVLVFSMIGYATKEVSVNGQTVINVMLAEDSQALDEVVLVGYSSKKKSNVTSAVSVVDLGGLEKTRVPNISQALQGQIAGVQVTSNSGAPGAPIQIQIRGNNSFLDGNPLYVVDGIPTTDISFLNQEDVKKMTILKDAAAAAMYGSRAGNGVVLIATNSGSKGKVSFDINYFTGLHNVTNLPTLLNADQYLNTLEKAHNNSNRTSPNPYTAFKSRTDLADTDWLDELFETGRSQNLQLSASGGSDKSQYLISLGYYDQDGAVVFDRDKFKKINFRTNLNSNLTERLKVGANVQLSHTKQDAIASTGESVIRFALLRAPILSVYKDVNDPTYSDRDPFTDLPFYTSAGYDQNFDKPGNPIAQVFFTNDVRKIFNTFGNVFAEYAFLKDKNLTFKTNLGIDYSFSHNKAFNENFGDPDGGNTPEEQLMGRNNRPNSLNESRGEAYTITYNNVLNYTKTFNNLHDFSVLIGLEFIDNFESGIGASRLRFPFTTNEFQFLNFGGLDDVENSGTASEFALFSYFGSSSYVYDNKYMFSANIRADSSSKFGVGFQWGYFPSFSAGWKVSSEEFLSNVDWLSNLKLRASWGQLGNQAIVDYSYLPVITQENGLIKQSRLANPEVSWETSTQTNIGLDVGLFNNKLALTAEYYTKDTDDVLLNISLPVAVAGFIEPTIFNTGKVNNKGFEFSANYRNSEHEFKYSINANFATLTNNVEELNVLVPNITVDQIRTEVGSAISSYYGFTMIGIYQDQAEIDSHLNAGNNVVPGDIKFKDVNGDGQITADKDREIIGSSIPDLTYGLGLSAGYKGFDFSMLFQGVEGIDRYNDGKKIIDFDSRPFNSTTAVLGAWDGPGSSNSIPRVTFDDNGSSNPSSIYVEDASYLRLKNIELGYTIKSLPQVQDIRLYISAQNLFTSTDYSGLDPETTDLIDKGTYPSSQSFLFGVNVKF